MVGKFSKSRCSTLSLSAASAIKPWLRASRRISSRARCPCSYSSRTARMSTPLQGSATLAKNIWQPVVAALPHSLSCSSAAVTRVQEASLWSRHGVVGAKPRLLPQMQGCQQGQVFPVKIYCHAQSTATGQHCMVLTRDLQAMMTVAPCCSKALVVSAPMPAFAPVTMAVLPRSMGGYTTTPTRQPNQSASSHATVVMTLLSKLRKKPSRRASGHGILSQAHTGPLPP
jgi:hypothetical protein